MRNLRVLFVAGLTPVPGGAAGGQVAQATTLLNSDFAHAIDVVPLSSTMECIPPPPMSVRLRGAWRRVRRFVQLLPSVDVVLVFSANGLSLIEKGLMCMLARALRRGVVVRLSSGYLPAECDRSVVLARWLRWTLRSAHVVCSQGTFWSGYFNRYDEASGKVMQISNGITLDPWRAPMRIACSSRIVFVGCVSREKGVFEALDVLKAIRQRQPSASLTVAGRGPDEEEFVTLVNDKGLTSCVRMLGWIPQHQVATLFAESDVLLFPSHAEGLPNVVLEAMAAGLPVVATRVGSIPDAIEHGKSGFLVDVGDCPSMVEAVNHLLSDRMLARAIAAQAREVAESKFDIARIWPLYAEALQRAGAAVGRYRSITATTASPSVFVAGNKG